MGAVLAACFFDGSLVRRTTYFYCECLHGSLARIEMRNDEQRGDGFS